MDVKQVLFGLATIDAEADLVRVASSRSFLPCEVFSSSEAVGARIGEGDLAVIQLERPTTANVAFRQLAPEDAIALVPNIRAVGFGQSDENGVLALRGKYAADIVIASRDCANIEQMFPFMTQYRCQSMHEMVAAGETDTCKGDSGGPAYVLKGDQFFLAAITSRSVDPGGACGAGGIYVKVAQERFRAFLTNNGVPSSAWTQ
jgi:hypothetical protein